MTDNKQLAFGDIVVVEREYIGVIVKCWLNSKTGNNYDVYVRSFNQIKNYQLGDVDRYLVRHKELSEEELEYQHIGVNNL